MPTPIRLTVSAPIKPAAGEPASSLAAEYRAFVAGLDPDVLRNHAPPEYRGRLPSPAAEAMERQFGPRLPAPQGERFGGIYGGQAQMERVGTPGGAPTMAEVRAWLRTDDK